MEDEHIAKSMPLMIWKLWIIGLLLCLEFECDYIVKFYVCSYNS